MLALNDHKSMLLSRCVVEKKKRTYSHCLDTGPPQPQCVELGKTKLRHASPQFIDEVDIIGLVVVFLALGVIGAIWPPWWGARIKLE
jgi:hypothetical protein